MNPIETVKGIYAAFGRGDIPAIVDAVSEDVVWEYAYAADTHSVIPWLTPRRAKTGVFGFFQALGAGLTVERFELNAVLGEGSRVVALVDLDAVVKNTGVRIVERDEVHVWYFDAAGKVVRFRHASDTLQHFRAVTGAR
jgi:ketosteroid isomerase-like protein